MVFYYEYKSAEEDKPIGSVEEQNKLYGGFLQADTYTEAMHILEDYAGSDLAEMHILQAYYNDIMCLPTNEARAIKEIYDKRA